MAEFSAQRTTTTHVMSCAALISAVLALSGCAATATVESAPNAHDPQCAEVMLALPEVIGDFDERPTNSQATAVWGDPSAVVLRCGVEPIGPTTDPCVDAAGVDWVTIEHDDHWQLISYGREPTVEVLLDLEQISSANAMLSLGSPVQQIEQSRQCVDLAQSIELTEDDDDIVQN